MRGTHDRVYEILGDTPSNDPRTEIFDVRRAIFLVAAEIDQLQAKLHAATK